MFLTADSDEQGAAAAPNTREEPIKASEERPGSKLTTLERPSSHQARTKAPLLSPQSNKWGPTTPCTPPPEHPELLPACITHTGTVSQACVAGFIACWWWAAQTVSGGGAWWLSSTPALISKPWPWDRCGLHWSL